MRGDELAVVTQQHVDQYEKDLGVCMTKTKKAVIEVIELNELVDEFDEFVEFVEFDDFDDCLFRLCHTFRRCSEHPKVQEVCHRTEDT